MIFQDKYVSTKFYRSVLEINFKDGMGRWDRKVFWERGINSDSIKIILSSGGNGGREPQLSALNRLSDSIYSPRMSFL